MSQYLTGAQLWSVNVASVRRVAGPSGKETHVAELKLELQASVISSEVTVVSLALAAVVAVTHEAMMSDCDDRTRSG